MLIVSTYPSHWPNIILTVFLINISFIHFKVKRTERDRQGLSPCRFTPKMLWATGLHLAKLRNLVLTPGLLHGWQGPKYLGCHLLPSTYSLSHGYLGRLLFERQWPPDGMQEWRWKLIFRANIMIIFPFLHPDEIHASRPNLFSFCTS